MVHEGFWDLYCKKPASADITKGKLEGWINHVMLKVPPGPPPPDKVEDGDDVPVEEPGPPVKAVVRVRIPFKREVAEEHAGEEVAEESKKEESKKESIDQEPTTEGLTEIDFEDRVLGVPVCGQSAAGE